MQYVRETAPTLSTFRSKFPAHQARPRRPWRARLRLHPNPRRHPPQSMSNAFAMRSHSSTVRSTIWNSVGPCGASPWPPATQDRYLAKIGQTWRPRLHLVRIRSCSPRYSKATVRWRAFGSTPAGLCRPSTKDGRGIPGGRSCRACHRGSSCRTAPRRRACARACR